MHRSVVERGSDHLRQPGSARAGGQLQADTGVPQGPRHVTVVTEGGERAHGVSFFHSNRTRPGGAAASSSAARAAVSATEPP